MLLLVMVIIESKALVALEFSIMKIIKIVFLIINFNAFNNNS